MEFKVKFEAEMRNYAIEKDGREIGINWLDRAREELSVSELSPDLVHGWISHLNTDPEIILTEKEARESERFNEKSTVIVKVEESALNEFVRSYLNVIRDPKDGKVLKVIFEWRIDKEAIFEWWREKGFPLTIKNKKKE